ncbi:MAG TPA: FecR domain-containing protein [Chitinivibrionales bacterium]|nr:FecR domain-containing protein [Chitinivibrionales bacterium]
MSTSQKDKQRIARHVVYTILAAAIAWRLVSEVRPLVFPDRSGAWDNYTVTITGNVLRPGQYSVPPGTTHFEILKVAGVRPTSDISQFELARPITDNQQLQVGTMPNPVTLKREPNKLRVEFFLDTLSVIAPDGKARPVAEGMEINQGDRVVTREKSQAELSVSAFSHIDIDHSSELAADRIAAAEGGRLTTALFQKSGTVWYKIAYGAKTDLFKITTPLVNVTVGGGGADFTITINPGRTDVSTLDGMLLVERVAGSEAINLISGQSAAVYGDNRPFQVTSLGAGAAPAERFSFLTKGKTSFMTRRMPFNFVFCGVPTVYYFGSVQYQTGSFHLVRLPSETSVEEFAQGCTTLDQAFLFGGGGFVSSLVEQILDMRVSKFCVLEKDDIIRVAGALGGINNVDVDEKAAGYMHLSRGPQKLTNQQLSTFLKPTLSGLEDFKARQIKVLKAIFNEFSSKNTVLTALLAQQVLAHIQTNVSALEAMDEYGKFSEVKGWAFKEHSLPVRQGMRGGRAIADPILDSCKTLLQ